MKRSERPFCPPVRATRRGNTVIEAALVLPILLALGFGAVEFGHFFYVKHSMQAAAREGARAAIVTGASDSAVNTAVLNSLNAAGLQNSGYTVTTVPTDVSTAAPGTQVTVTVQCNWGTVGWRPLALISASKSVAGGVAMRRE